MKKVDEIHEIQKRAEAAKSTKEKRQAAEAEARQREAEQAGAAEAQAFARDCYKQIEQAAAETENGIRINAGWADDYVKRARLKKKYEGAIERLRKKGFAVELETQYISGAYDNAMECSMDGSTHFYIAVKW